MLDSSPSPDGLVRARAWLGTLVEIRADTAGRSRWEVEAAIDAAFDEIATVHRLMSRQERGIDVARLVEADVGAVVSLDTRTAEVLRLALEFQEESLGAFDVECRDRLAARAWPGPAWAFEEADAVRVLRRAAVDLDGIAKGYAVDRAIEVLQSRGVDAIVNAGGDLRSTMACAGPLLVRCPWVAGGFVDMGRLRAGAFATSQSPACRDTGLDLAGTGVVDRRPGGAGLPAMTISVAAASCAVADALTKVVAVDPQASVLTLEKRDAAAWILRESGDALCMLRVGSSSTVYCDAA